MYVADQGDDAIRVYDVAADGTLTWPRPRAAETKPVQVTLSPDGRSAYATNSRSGSVSQYAVAADGVALAQDARQRPGGPDPGGYRR